MTDARHRALVVGLGIAGMSAAIGLRDAGWEPIVIERAPARRSGGYFVGLFPDGKKAAQELGVLAGLHTRNPTDGTNWQVDVRGRQKSSIGFLAQPGEPYAVMRGDIEQALWDRLQGEAAARADQQPVEIRFSTRPVEILNDGDQVRVRLEDLASGEQYTELFDLVVGTDGLRSTVRQLVFGEHDRFMRPWNAIICAFELDEQVPGYAPQDGVTLALPKRAAWTFPFADRTPTVLLTYRTKAVDAQFAQASAKSLESVYGDLRSIPVVRHSLESFDGAAHSLFDSVNSVHMPSWSEGRVVLLGDSAWCLTLYSGTGSTAALRGGHELATALIEHPDDVPAALAAWEQSLRPFITTSLRRARVLQHMFVPTGRVSWAVRNAVLGLIDRMMRAKERRTVSASPPPCSESTTV